MEGEETEGEARGELVLPTGESGMTSREREEVVPEGKSAAEKYRPRMTARKIERENASQSSSPESLTLRRGKSSGGKPRLIFGNGWRGFVF